jgi:hypothetical protein
VLWKKLTSEDRALTTYNGEFLKDEEQTQAEIRFHTGRATSGHCDHRHFGWIAFACGTSST